MTKHRIFTYAALALLAVAVIVLPSRGATGPQGTPGADGERGRIGLRGPDGLDGLRGGQGIRGLQGEQGATGELGRRGLPGIVGDPGVVGVFASSPIDTERTKSAMALCPEDSYMIYSGTRALVGDKAEPPWIVLDVENTGPTLWWLGFVGTWVDVSDPPVDIPWQVQTFGLCLDSSFVGK